MLRDALRKIFDRRELPYDESWLPGVADPQRIKNRERDNNIVSHFMASTVDQRHAGNWGEALHAAVSCLTLHPLDPYYYKPVVYAVAPLRLIDWYRARKSAQRTGALLQQRLPGQHR
jgi:hypothetical protein